MTHVIKSDNPDKALSFKDLIADVGGDYDTAHSIWLKVDAGYQTFWGEHSYIGKG